MSPPFFRRPTPSPTAQYVHIAIHQYIFFLFYRRYLNSHEFFFSSFRPTPQCGNGQWDQSAGEECDASVPEGTPTGCADDYFCDSNCKCHQRCGDGTHDMEAGEECDPNASPTGCDNGYYCDAQCGCQPLCGNGVIDTGETCDYEKTPDDGCPPGSTCTTGCICQQDPTPRYVLRGSTLFGVSMLCPHEHIFLVLFSSPTPAPTPRYVFESSGTHFFSPRLLTNDALCLFS